MQQTHQTVHSVGRTELAQRYFPYITPHAAWKKLRALLAKYAEVELLLKIGEYKKGTDPETDEAVAKNAAVNNYLKQGLDERPTYEDSIAKLKQAVS